MLLAGEQIAPGGLSKHPSYALLNALGNNANAVKAEPYGDDPKVIQEKFGKSDASKPKTIRETILRMGADIPVKVAH